MALRTVALVLGSTTLLLACNKSSAPDKPSAASSPSASAASVHSAPPVGTPALSRGEFNALAVRAAEPVFWVADANQNGALDPSELAVYSAYGKSPALTEYVDGGKLTPAFEALTKKLNELKAGPAKDLPAAELARQQAIVAELGAGRVSLVQTDFSDLSANTRAAIRHILEAAQVSERLYQKQMGVFDLVAADDSASHAALWRNQSATCTTPVESKNPQCHATKDKPEGLRSGLYPKSLLAQKNFCTEVLGKSADKALLDPFTAVAEVEGKLKAVPYHVYFAEDLGEMAKHLDAAATALGEEEPALKEYLSKAAQAARDGSWFAADEAWAKMSADNSKLYLRIGPDEVYSEPCSVKALFHTSFARINQDSVALQKKLDALKGAMEQELGTLAGAPYKPRQVSFKLPDFIDVAWNAGDARAPSGATIGQSLPNFGPMANQGRGRTVAMTNFYLDEDNVTAAKNAAESLLCKDTFSRYSTKPDAQLLSTVLHEAAHNLGPSHQYKVGGKIDRDAFGGPLASTLEELKAQSSALYLADWLKDKGELTAEQADQAHVRDLTWAFGHISRGMTTEDGHPRNYSQLAAIQLGVLTKSGAVAFRAEETAANGKDTGCFSLDAAKFPAAAKELVTAALQVKAKGYKKTAEGWQAEFVADGAEATKVHAVIRERLLRSPKASFVFGVRGL